MTFKPPLSRKMMMGNGVEITDPMWIADHLHEYISFTEAAPIIHPNWTRHNLHRERNQGRMFASEILIVQDQTAYGSANTLRPFNEGRKFFITKKEVERLRIEHLSRPHRKVLQCQFGCGRSFNWCYEHPCYGRQKDGRGFRQTVEAAAEYFERFRTTAGTRKRHFSAFNRRGERKNFVNTKGKTFGRDNESLGEGSDGEGQPSDDGTD